MYDPQERKGSDVNYNGFPDISRLKKLQTIKYQVFFVGYMEAGDTLRLLHQNPLFSVRNLYLDNLGGDKCPQKVKFVSKMNYAVPNLKNFSIYRQ